MVKDWVNIACHHCIARYIMIIRISVYICISILCS